MTHFLLDTNIIIKDPSILTRWSPNYKIIIPRFLFAELDRVTTRLGPVGQFWKIIEQSTRSGFVTILETDIAVSEDLHAKNSAQKLSYIDLQLFEIARQLIKENKDVVLVTNDRALRVFSEENKIKTFDLLQFHNFINAFKTTELDQLKENETINQFQNRKFIYGLIFGIILTLISFLVKDNFQIIFDKINVWGTIILMLISGIVFFLFRTNYRMFYGVTEFLFGFYISMRVFTGKSFNYDEIGIVELIQAVGGIYVMVRGLSNIDDGIKGMKFEPTWKKITRWRKIASA